MKRTETYSRESIAVAGIAIGFTVAKIAVSSDNGLPVRAVCSLENAPIRFTVDGSTTPTSSIGRKLVPGETLVLDSLKDLGSFRAIRTGSVSGVLKVSYEREVS